MSTEDAQAVGAPRWSPHATARRQSHVALRRTSGPSWLPLLGSATLIAALINLIALSTVRGNRPRSDSEPTAPGASPSGPASR